MPIYNRILTVSEAEIQLSKHLRINKLCIFTGSGISVDSPSCLPTWDGFVLKYIELGRDLYNAIKTYSWCDSVPFSEVLSTANDDYAKNKPIEVVTAIKSLITACKRNGINQSILDNFDAKLTNLFSTRQINDYHKTIVTTNYKHILTTNYDRLLEEAAEQQSQWSLVRNTFNFTQPAQISEALYLERSSILHVHGDLKQVTLNNFILTKDDYKKIKDKNPSFRTIINSLFMTHSFLMIGYGGSDPHMEDVIEDINLSLGWLDTDNDGAELPIYYIVLKNEKTDPIMKNNKARNRTQIIGIEDFNESLSLLKNLQEKFPRKTDDSNPKFI